MYNRQQYKLPVKGLNKAAAGFATSSDTKTKNTESRWGTDVTFPRKGLNFLNNTSS